MNRCSAITPQKRPDRSDYGVRKSGATHSTGLGIGLRSVAGEGERSRPLRPNELNVGERTQGRSPVSADHPDGRPMGPAELGYRGGLFGSIFGGQKEEAAQFIEEPPRTALTEPPVGYQTPSPNQPYTAKPDRWL